MNLGSVILCTLVGAAYMQTDIPNINFEDAKKMIQGFNLSPELVNTLPTNKTVIDEYQNKTEELLRNKCEQNGGLGAFERAKEVYLELPICFTSFVDMKVLEKEINDAKPTGSVDEVFKKYCQKKSQLMDCVTNLLNATEPCLEIEERANIKVLHNISQELIDFACFKDGDRLALFLSEGGVECFEEKKDGLQKCFNQTAAQNITTDINSLSVDSLPKLILDEKHCGSISETGSCVVGVLETCQKPSAANIVESLIKFLRNKTPCKAYPTAEKKEGSANEIIAKMSSIFIGLLTVMLL